MTYFVKEKTLGHSFTTFTNGAGEQVRVSIGVRRIGPFPSIAAVADYLAVNAFPQANYEIEEIKAPVTLSTPAGHKVP
jgi:hypothetical protein